MDVLLQRTLRDPENPAPFQTENFNILHPKIALSEGFSTVSVSAFFRTFT
jgi:hypothetical protein